MQAVISPVDHESRSNPYNDDVMVEPAEDTPLLVTGRERERDIRTIVSVGVLVFVLIVGAIIGIYLLVLQNDAENILPPDIEPADLLRRWDKSSGPFQSGTFKATKVIITQTNTEQCFHLTTCANILNDLHVSQQQQHLPYNYLVSSNGLVLEAPGSRSPSPLHPSVTTLIIALIGNFTEVAPEPTQVRVTANFVVNLAENHGCLNSNYKVVIHNKTTQPNLYQSFENIPHFSRSPL